MSAIKDDESTSDSDRELSLGDSNLETKTSGKKRPLPEKLSAAATSEGIKSPHKIERKRLREQRRRADLGERFADLTSLLREIDPDFRDLNSQDGSIPPVASLESNTLTRLDVITHAISTLRRIHNENQLRQRIIEQISANTLGQQSDSQLFSYAGSGLRGNVYADHPGILGLLQPPTPRLSSDRRNSFATGFQGRGDHLTTQALLNDQRAHIASRLAPTHHFPDSPALSHLGQMGLFPRHEPSLNPLLFNPASALTLSQLSTAATASNPSTFQLQQERLRNLHNTETTLLASQHQEADNQDEVENDGASSS